MCIIKVFENCLPELLKKCVCWVVSIKNLNRTHLNNTSHFYSKMQFEWESALVIVNQLGVIMWGIWKNKNHPSICKLRMEIGYSTRYVGLWLYERESTLALLLVLKCMEFLSLSVSPLGTDSSPSQVPTGFVTIKCQNLESLAFLIGIWVVLSRLSNLYH